MGTYNAKVMNRFARWIITIVLLLLFSFAMVTGCNFAREAYAINRIQTELIAREDLGLLAHDCLKLLHRMEADPGLKKLSSGGDHWGIVPSTISSLSPQSIYLSSGTGNLTIQFGGGRANVLFLTCNLDGVMILKGPRMKNGSLVIYPQ